MTTHKHEPEHVEHAHAAKPVVATASTTVAMPPGDPNDYVQAWVEAEEDSIPDSDGQVHKVKVSRLGWKKK